MGIDKQYSKLTDEEIIEKIRGGDLNAQDYLIEKYKRLVIKKARSKYFIVGADYDDIIQEGSIGLFKAIRDYNPTKNAGFFTFAELCIERQMITAIKSAGRQKHQPLNTYLSLNRNVYDKDEDLTYIELLCNDNSSNPEALVIGNEEYESTRKKIDVALSKLEQRVLELFLSGNSYTEIAAIIGRDEKSIDNALQRIKKKIEKIVAKKN